MTMQEFLKEIDTHREILSDTAIEFLDELIEKNSSENLLTDVGKKILITMLEKNEAYLNVFTAKQLGELLFMSARSVSGAMRKLVTEQYVVKSGTNPVTYNLTPEGKTVAKGLSVDKN